MSFCWYQNGLTVFNVVTCFGGNVLIEVPKLVTSHPLTVIRIWNWFLEQRSIEIRNSGFRLFNFSVLDVTLIHIYIYTFIFIYSSDYYSVWTNDSTTELDNTTSMIFRITFLAYNKDFHLRRAFSAGYIANVVALRAILDESYSRSNFDWKWSLRNESSGVSKLNFI